MHARYEDHRGLPSPEPEPWLYRDVRTPHYYGDNVRELLVAAAALMLIAAPFYADEIGVQIPVLIVAAIVLVALSAFTSPRGRSILVADTIAAGVGFVLFELWAFVGYGSIPMLAFGLRQAVAVIFLFAFYFGGKTVRAVVFEHKGPADAEYQPSSYRTDPPTGAAEDADEDEPEYIEPERHGSYRRQKPEDDDE